ncbi:MAG: hypothetical protein M5R41_10195 [Bacteroidia bacterium]|nr:hypothetical protein [Bacteroidia bacterium]
MLTHFTHSLVALFVLFGCSPLNGQDGVSWLQTEAPFGVHSSAFVQLHGGQHSGRSFGLTNVLSVDLTEQLRFEGAILLDGRHMNATNELSMHSALAAGLRVRLLAEPMFILPVHAGWSSAISYPSAADVQHRQTLLYAGIRPAWRFLDNAEIVGTAGILWLPRSGTTQTNTSIGIRIASFFTFSIDLTSVVEGERRQNLPALILR